ncbi:MAG: biotin-dependent carboxyltransferase family protein [Xanthomonadaceae bacterium]|nr:biotin-dependent carboxyltransferase family protein [Xanthomonadaceae bacterium]
MIVQVLRPGLLTTLQDAGRPGHAALGIGRSGTADRPAWQLANALVGNCGDEAALEITLQGPTLRFGRAARIALTGAPIDARVDDAPLPPWTAVDLPSGTVLRLRGMRQGCRSYLAVRGGFAVPAVLGSRSEDLHARLGPLGGRALVAGDALPLDPTRGIEAAERLRIRRWGIDPQPWFDFAMGPLGLLPGSHAERLDAASRQRLHRQPFRLASSSNRTGARLEGEALALAAPLELVSEAVLPGTVQLPPSGQPIALLAEAPVTGGYPRIGQVAAADLPTLAQRRPGDAVQFTPIALDEALERQHRRGRELHRLVQRVLERGESER